MPEMTAKETVIDLLSSAQDDSDNSVEMIQAAKEILNDCIVIRKEDVPEGLNDFKNNRVCENVISCLSEYEAQAIFEAATLITKEME